MIAEVDFLNALGFERPADIIKVTVPTRVCGTQEEVYGYTYLTSTAIRDLELVKSDGGSPEARKYLTILIGNVAPSVREKVGYDIFTRLDERIAQYPESFDLKSETSIFALYNYYVVSPAYHNRVSVTLNALPEAKRDFRTSSWLAKMRGDGSKAELRRVPGTRSAPTNLLLDCMHKVLQRPASH